jgi:putative transposase
MDWKSLLASITGSVDEELRWRNAYLAAENRILRNQLKGRRVQLTDAERKTLAEMGQKLGRQALAEVATIAKPDTILGWHRTLVVRQSDSSLPCKSLGRPRIDQELEALVLRMARENRSWGYDRIVGALANLGYRISDQSVGNILKRHGIPPAPARQTTMTWREFIRIHMDLLGATDFFANKVWTWCRLVTSTILFFLHLSRRKVPVTGMKRCLHAWWMRQIAPHTMRADGGFLPTGLLLLHARDGQDFPIFQPILEKTGVTCGPLPARAPDGNPYAGRWVHSVKSKHFSRLILYGKRALRYGLSAFASHDYQNHPHPGKDPVILMPLAHSDQGRDGLMHCRGRLSGLLTCVCREAA